MRRALISVLLLAAALAGCGSTTKAPPPTTIKAPTPFVCNPAAPGFKPQAGECERQRIRSEHHLTVPAPLKASSRAQGIDISRYQPHPDFRRLYEQGIRFAIVQGADDCSESNPFFDEQVRDAHAAGVEVGVYVFVEGAPASCQAGALERAAAPVRSLIVLGATADGEVPAAYPQACAVIADLASHFSHVLNYGSPGTSRTGRCEGYVFGACWGGGPPCTLPGYPLSAVKVRQWCGTCFLDGGEIDRDEDLGLLALAHPTPPPSRSALRARQRTLVRVLDADGCRRRARDHEHEGDRCRRWKHELDHVNRELA